MRKLNLKVKAPKLSTVRLYIQMMFIGQTAMFLVVFGLILSGADEVRLVEPNIFIASAEFVMCFALILISGYVTAKDWRKWRSGA